MSPVRVKITAYVVSAAYSIALALSGVHLPNITTKVLSFLPAVIVVGFAGFDQWLWRLRPLGKVLHMPNLVGTWHGELISMRPDDAGHEVTHPPMPVILTIRQTFTSISLTLMTAESKSRSMAESLVRNANGDYTLYYQYHSVPVLVARAKMQIHNGGAALEIAGHYPASLEGEYWTNRKTRGTFKLAKIDSKVAGSFQEATASVGKA